MKNRSSSLYDALLCLYNLQIVCCHHRLFLTQISVFTEIKYRCLEDMPSEEASGAMGGSVLSSELSYIEMCVVFFFSDSLKKGPHPDTG